MSIIGRSSMREAVPFFEEGLRATEGVVLLSSVTSSGAFRAAATGWLVSPRLVLTMSYAVEPAVSSKDVVVEVAWSSRGGTPGSRANARTVWRGDGARFSSLEALDIGISNLDVALLELEGKRPSSRFLNLNLGPLQLPDDVYVLQYNGASALMQSSGALFHQEEGLLFYDADTLGGAGGAPLFNEAWQVIGIHAGSAPSLPAIGRTERSNFGVSLPWVIERLRAAPQWEEIASRHRLLGPKVHVQWSMASVGSSRAMPQGQGGGCPARLRGARHRPYAAPARRRGEVELRSGRAPSGRAPAAGDGGLRSGCAPVVPALRRPDPHPARGLAGGTA
jgi:hypothetical protein